MKLLYFAISGLSFTISCVCWLSGDFEASVFFILQAIFFRINGFVPEIVEKKP